MSCIINALTVPSKFFRNALALQRILAGWSLQARSSTQCIYRYTVNMCITWAHNVAHVVAMFKTLATAFLPNVYQNSEPQCNILCACSNECHLKVLNSQQPKHLLLLLSTVSNSAFWMFHRCHKMSCGAALVWQGLKDTNFLIYVPGTCFYNTWSSF